MKDMLFVACLALLAFGAVNLIFSVAVLVGVRRLRFDCRPRAQARRYLLVRAFPGTVSLLFVATLFLPILCRHEPGGEDEQLGLAMALLAAAAASIIVVAAVRGLHGIWVTRRLSKSWGFSARALDIGEFPIPAFVIEAAFPVVAIVGIRRQRLYVARQVLERCSADEFAAIVAHERAHLRHGDNVARLLLLSCPDLLIFTPMARRLEGCWAEASEEAADDEVAKTGAGLALASALCKVARLARGSSPIPAVALHNGQGVAHRINRLIRPETTTPAVASRGRFDGLQFAILIAVVLAGAGAELPRLHAVTEAMVLLLK
jgi:Zn-dependent protease with chaperone function